MNTRISSSWRSMTSTTRLAELQQDLDAWLDIYNKERTHQGKMCCGRTPPETFDDGMRIWKEKLIGNVAA